MQEIFIDKIRPEITLESLDLENAEDVNLEDECCCYIRIPLKCTDINSKKYDYVLKGFLDKYLFDNGEDNILGISSKLELVINNIEDEPTYFLQSFIKIDNFGEQIEECVSEQIKLTDIEQARVNLALLKFTNPQEYLRQYTRQQFANLPEIKNKLGFVMDEIDEQNLYKSVWITPNYEIGLIGYVLNVDNPKSKIHFKSIGKQ